MGAEGRYGEGGGGRGSLGVGMPCGSMLEGELAAFELIHDADDVGAGFGVRRDAVIAVDGGGACVVSGEREGQAVRIVVRVVAVEKLIKIGGAAGDVLVGPEGVVDAELMGGAGHELHEAAGSGARDGVGVEAAFGADDAGEEVGINVVLGAGLADEFRHVGSWCQRCGCRGGQGCWRIGKGFDGGDGFAREIDEVRSLGGEEEANVGVVDGLVAGAVVGEAIAERDALKCVRTFAQKSSEKEGGT